MQVNNGASQVALVVKNLPATMEDVDRDVRSIPGSERAPAGGHGKPLQCSCLKNPMNRGAWQATVHSTADSQTGLKQWHSSTVPRSMAKKNVC